MLVWLYRRCPKILSTFKSVQPQTLIRWHRIGFQACWRWKSRNLGSRPRVDRDLRDLIRRMCAENPLWGAPRILGELLKLGFKVAQSTVSKYMIPNEWRPPQTWKTFLRNNAKAIASIDLFVVPTAAFECLYVFIVLGHGRRGILRYSVTRHPTAEWLARQLIEAFPWDTAPRFLIRDNDRAYGNVFRRSVGRMGIRDRPISPRSPWQYGYVERVIGSIRRECLDHFLVWSEAHLERVLAAYVTYYNVVRTHLALAKDAPRHRPIQAFGTLTAHPVLGGLYHCYARI